MTIELDFDLSIDDFTRFVRGRTSEELRKILIEHWRDDVQDYSHGELIEALIGAYTGGVTPVTAYSRAELVQEVIELHPNYDDASEFDTNDEPNE